MKNLLLLLLFVTGSAFAQISKVETPETVEVGKITPGGIKTIYCEKVDNRYYVFYYRDVKFTRIEEWKEFKINSEEDFNDVLDIVMQGFEDIPEEDIMLDISNGYLFLNYKKIFGKPYLRFGHSNSAGANAVIGFSNQYNERQVKRLFGKK